MRLTIKQLQSDIQERFDSMNTQIQHSTIDRYELHMRADRILLNLDKFRKDTELEFRDVHAEINELRTEMRAGFAQVRADIDEMRVGNAEMRVAYAEMRQAYADIVNQLKRM